MESRALIRITLASGILAAVGAAGCSLVKAEDTGSSPDKVTSGGDVSGVLKSTLQLQGGCTAAKVGPRQLLVAARAGFAQRGLDTLQLVQQLVVGGAKLLHPQAEGIAQAGDLHRAAGDLGGNRSEPFGLGVNALRKALLSAVKQR